MRNNFYNAWATRHNIPTMDEKLTAAGLLPQVPAVSLIALDQELKRRFGADRNGYRVARMSIVQGNPTYDEMVERYITRIETQKWLNKREGHRRARMIAKVRRPNWQAENDLPY